ncbi:gamma-glutamylcyclotransferase [Candidatus Pseudothioglobus singularis]|nr:gamma-glutamylcyclotransferase [Candidatus Pseudothioglobus singularis]
MPSLTNHYFGYGSNLSKDQMFVRCPDSSYLTSGRLSDYSWFINTRGYASVRQNLNDFVLGEIFTLSDKDIELLDIYESVAEGMYEKFMMSVSTLSGAIDCLVYIATDKEIGQPQAEYIERINAGIRSANLPSDYVQKSIRPFVPES